MDTLNIKEYSLKNISKINIILGKNGCGKSTLIRNIEEGLSGQPQNYGKSKYITPERGGSLVYEAGVEQSLTNDANWLQGQRRKNQVIGFRQQSIAQYKKLELLVLKEIEGAKRSNLDYTFNLYINKINTLLDNIEIRRDTSTFKIYKKGSEIELNATNISSGESELVSLGIECLVFSKECISGKENFLFLDEPDVHLHPDLQVRLMHFLKDLVLENNFKVFITTHSTAILGALEGYAETNLAFMFFGQKEVEFQKITQIHRKILPVFGAHPLSNIFNQAPILLVEGEDDERIWQQAVRSSEGKLKIYPCSVDSITKMNDFEIEAQKIILNVYDSAKGYSLRDKDDTTEEIEDLESITRMKLSCRSSENLLLSDEALSTLNTTWGILCEKIEIWLTLNETHQHYLFMKNFKDDGFDRKNHDLKEIRNDLMGIIGSPKPWEIVVGKTISDLILNKIVSSYADGKISNFLGHKIMKNLILKD